MLRSHGYGEVVRFALSSPATTTLSATLQSLDRLHVALCLADLVCIAEPSRWLDLRREWNIPSETYGLVSYIRHLFDTLRNNYNKAKNSVLCVKRSVA